MRRRWRAATITLLGTTLLAASARAAPQRLWAKAAVSGATMLSDFDACRQGARNVQPNIRLGYATSLGVVGSAVTRAIAIGIEEHDAATAYIRHCMHGRGYYGVAMSPEEIARYRTLGAAAERAAWTDQVYASPGFGPRLQAAMTPAVPPLPEAEDSPGAIGALKLDPKSLMPASGVVGAGQAVLTGQAAHRRTATAPEDVRVHPGFELTAGTVMHELVGPSDDDPNQTFWCGPFKFHALVGYTTTGAHYCVWFDDDGYAVEAYDGLDGLAVDTNFNVPPYRAAQAPLRLELSDHDLIGPMAFSLMIAKVGDAAVTLRAQATLNGKTAIVWTVDVPFNQDGKATLPFWTHRLVLQRAGAGVTVAYSADGDGKGPGAKPLP